MESQEIELVARAQNGDKSAFNRLVETYDRLVYQIAFNMIGNAHDAQDIFQETFIKAYANLPGFRFESEFKTWLCRIVINQSINQRKKRRLKNWISFHGNQDQQNDKNNLPELTDLNAPDVQFRAKEFNQALLAALDKLSALQRSVFTLKHFQGYKIREIAAVMHCSEGTIKNALFRALKKLQVQLAAFQCE
jgi:RNA polymerase sigma-70 factor, ECF subfamily